MYRETVAIVRKFYSLINGARGNLCAFSIVRGRRLGGGVGEGVLADGSRAEALCNGDRCPAACVCVPVVSGLSVKGKLPRRMTHRAHSAERMSRLCSAVTSSGGASLISQRRGARVKA